MKNKSFHIALKQEDLVKQNPVAKLLASGKFRQRRIDGRKPSIRGKKRFINSNCGGLS